MIVLATLYVALTLWAFFVPALFPLIFMSGAMCVLACCYGSLHMAVGTAHVR